MSAASLHAVEVRRGGRVVLSGLDLDVRVGELLAVAGPNGAGKSTLLGLLAGDLVPSAGEVRVAGRALREWPDLPLARQRAVLSQQPVSPFGFRAVEVVRMGRAPWRGHPAQEHDEEHVAAALSDTASDGLAHRPVTALSGGERARVDLARVLAQDTSILLLDEPTAALDLHHSARVLDHLRGLARVGAAVVVVVHDLELAAAYGDRVALVGEGRLLAVGSPAEVLTGPLLSRTYGHPVDVVPHPVTGGPLVLPRR